MRTFGSGDVATIALHNVSLELFSGEFTLLMGPSGSGKSTLLAALSGLLRPDSGRVHVLGQDLWHMSDRAREAFRKVLELDPTSAKAFENLGEDELATGELAKAVPDLKRALDLEPRLFDALYNLAMALDRLGRRDEARPLIERFIREAPRERYATDIERLQELIHSRR